MNEHSEFLLLSILTNILINDEIGDEYAIHNALKEIDEYFNIEIKPEHSALEKSFNKYSKINGTNPTANDDIEPDNLINPTTIIVDDEVVPTPASESDLIVIKHQNKDLINRIETIQKYINNSLNQDLQKFFKFIAESDELRASDNTQHEKLFKHISALLKFIQTEKKRIDLIDARIDDLSDSVCTKFSELNERISDKSESMKNQYDIYKQYADNAIDVFGAEIEKLKKDVKTLDDEIYITNNKIGESGVDLDKIIRQLKKEIAQLKQDFAILLHTNFVEKIDALEKSVAEMHNKISLMVQHNY